jgi:hypothetical protein
MVNARVVHLTATTSVVDQEHRSAA